MEIIKLRERGFSAKDKKAYKEHQKMVALIDALDTRDIPPEILKVINDDITMLNSVSGTDKVLIKALRKTHTKILRLLEKELNLVSKNHYSLLWMALGISVFGVSFGTAISAATGNYAFLGVGIAFGVPMGLAIGTALDKKAEKEGRQLDIEKDSY